MELNGSLETEILLRNAMRLGVSAKARDAASLATAIRERLGELGHPESRSCSNCRRAIPDFSVCPYCSAPLATMAAGESAVDGQRASPPVSQRGLLAAHFSPQMFLRPLMKPYYWLIVLLATAPMVLKFFGLTEKWMFVYFSLLWAYVFFRIADAPKGLWRAAVAGYVFTAAIALPLLVAWITVPPHITENLVASSNALVRLAGFIFGIGLREELTKVLVVVWMATIRIEGKPILATPGDALVVGSMCGLGFAAVENMDYLERFQFLDRVHYTFGLYTDNLSFRGSMSRVMMTPFVHAVWAGIFGYFVVTALRSRTDRWPIAALGLGTAAVLHGFYNLVAGLPGAEMLIVVVVAISFAIWLGCLYHAQGEHSS
jgi:RsiW-degrading membrane proteinase PrsW (M82 family)